MRSITIATFLLVSYFTYGLVLSQWSIQIWSPELKNEQPTDFYDYKGATNILTELSIGQGDPLKVISAAKTVGLDFLFFTDLNPFDIPHAPEGYHGNLLVMSGGLFSYLDSRLLYYSLTTDQPQSLGDAQVRFTDYLSQRSEDTKNHFLVLAHPKLPGFAWSGAYPQGLNGLEVLNLKSIFLNGWKASKLSFLWSLVVFPFNQELAFIRLFQEPTEELALWDSLNQKQKTVGYAGSNATAKAIAATGYIFEFPSYTRYFQILSNHILLRSELTGNASADKQKVFSAFKKGNFYMSLDLLGDPKGFVCQIEDGDKKHFMGSSISFNKRLKLNISLPGEPRVPYEVVIFKDGQRLTEFSTTKISYPLEQPGVYRVQVRVIPTFPLPDGKKWISWIYTNSFYVKP